jgi:hypothetical protein
MVARVVEKVAVGTGNEKTEGWHLFHFTDAEAGAETEAEEEEAADSRRPPALAEAAAW